MVILFADRKTLRFPVDIAPLEKFGVVRSFDDMPDAELADNLKDVQILITNQNRLNNETLQGAETLLLICQAGTGYDNIDVDYCRKQNIAVANVSGYAVESVAQHTFAMLFHLMSNSDYEFFELKGKTWGVIGLGSIGQRVAELAESFGCHVCYCSVATNRADDRYERVELEDLLQRSDVVSIHTALGPKTKNLIGRDELNRMKPSAILLNLGRGGVVNEDELARALDEGIIKAAGLDVLETEPITNQHPLLKLKHSNRILITPHIAFGSSEARRRLMEGIAANIQSFLEGGRRNRID
jgi:glycerate dehydrogenase